jgi:hypothetical protein
MPKSFRAATYTVPLAFGPDAENDSSALRHAVRRQALDRYPVGFGVREHPEG